MHKYNHVPFHCLIEAVALNCRRLEDLVFAVLDGGKTECIGHLGDGHGTFDVLFIGKDTKYRLPQLLLLDQQCQ